MALRNLGVDYEVVATAEIDKYAIMSYGAIHEDLMDNIGKIPQGDKEWKKKTKEKLAKKGIKAPRSYKKNEVVRGCR